MPPLARRGSVNSAVLLVHVDDEMAIRDRICFWRNIIAVGIRVRSRYEKKTACTGWTPRMRSLPLALCFSIVAGAAGAQERPYTPGMSCQAAQAVVARQRDITVASSANAYEMVHHESGACGREMTALPAFEPTLDNAQCFVGYRCREQNNSGSDGAK